ncbi:MAG: pyruvate, phosphate dikinase [Clostridia bacterium]|nr:pyruvate, phosphate dikinase [Clostridia bacterium]
MKYVYLFSEGDAGMRNLLGGKGANLCEMTRLGLPVPSGFVISTDACLDFYEKNGLDAKIENQIFEAINQIEKLSNKVFGSTENPLIVSVRSGARVSMPGMMDSILNLGLNDSITKSFAKSTKNEWFAYDCYRRFIQMYSNVVMGIDKFEFEKQIDKTKKQNNINLDNQMSVQNLKDLIKSFKQIYKEKIKKPFPQDVKLQLLECVKSVFLSWNNPRAITYRKLNNIPDDWGTAVNVQRMVFGNFNQKSGTGVCFSRSPSSGENVFFGEYLMEAQGEDVVAGVRTPQPISHLKEQNESLFVELHNNALILEHFYKDMQDIEFSIEDDKLFILQTRNGKRTATASIKIAVDLVKENEIDEIEALNRIEPEKLKELLLPILDIKPENQPIAKGLPASGGGTCGSIVFSSEKAVELAKQNIKTILVRLETSPEDIEGMTVVGGILTAHGGMTSHAAVVARGMGIVCVVGCQNLEFLSANKIKLGDHIFSEGDILSVDGSTGNVFKDQISTISATFSPEYNQIIEWAEKYKKIGVRANADTPQSAKTAFDFFAEGIGLCRTEHMFFEKNRIFEMRKLIIAETKTEREKALKKLLSFQKSDFEGIFKEMKGKPVTIRLLDPPLHEFLPKTEAQIKELATAFDKPLEYVKEIVSKLQEVNPMMGHRGLRLAITFPEIYQMQTRAIIQSALQAKKKYNFDVVPEIMIPLASDINEFLFVKNLVKQTADSLILENQLTYKIGTMIETPRAVLIAEKLAENCDFFSFGTNDLTQFVFGISRDDSNKFLPEYLEKGIIKQDIFKSVDEQGVGKMMEEAIAKAKKANPNITFGVCGEHGGDPKSIAFFKKIGINYVSCSVYRIPTAKLAGV